MALNGPEAESWQGTYKYTYDTHIHTYTGVHMLVHILYTPIHARTQGRTHIPLLCMYSIPKKHTYKCVHAPRPQFAYDCTIHSNASTRRNYADLNAAHQFWYLL